MTDNERDKLEIEFIDKYDIALVLKAISEICFAKAQYIRENWGPPLAGDSLYRNWDSWGRQIDTLRAKNQTNMKYAAGLL